MSELNAEKLDIELIKYLAENKKKIVLQAGEEKVEIRVEDSK